MITRQRVWLNSACVKGERLSGRVVRKREPVSLKCSEGLVNANNRREPVCLKCSERPVTVSSRSSSICIEGRARQ